MNAIKEIIVRAEDEGSLHAFNGRAAWALNELYEAGERGCTPIDNPAPRWSHYIYLIRRSGLVVETIDEKHGGPYKGYHGRYVLRTPVTVLKEVRA